MLGEKFYITESQTYTIIGVEEAEPGSIVDLVLNLKIRDDCTGLVSNFGLWSEDSNDPEASLYVCLPSDEPEYEDDPLDVYYLEKSLSSYGVKFT